MDNIRFSILIPVYNREALVKECIDSVLSQTFSDFEIIAIDDGSSDRTFEVLQSYGKRIISLHQENRGPQFARIFGLSRARGEYLVFLDSDDTLFQDALKTYNHVIETFQFPAMVIAKMHYYTDQLEPETVNSSFTVKALKFRDYFSKEISVGLSCSNIIIKRSVFTEAGGSWKPVFPADEHDTVLRFGAYGPCIVLQRPKTVAYRLHAGNSIKDIARMINIGILALIRSEINGRYPGGLRRCLERYTIIGGMSVCWTWKAFRFHMPLLGLKLLFLASPYIVGGGLQKLYRFLRRRTRPVVFGTPPIEPIITLTDSPDSRT